jgi:hypothetical protein
MGLATRTLGPIGEGGRAKRRFVDADRQFLGQLAAQRGARKFAVLDLAPGKLPQAAVMLLRRCIRTRPSARVSSPATTVIMSGFLSINRTPARFS